MPGASEKCNELQESEWSDQWINRSFSMMLALCFVTPLMVTRWLGPCLNTWFPLPCMFMMAGFNYFFPSHSEFQPAVDEQFIYSAKLLTKIDFTCKANTFCHTIARHCFLIILLLLPYSQWTVTQRRASHRGKVDIKCHWLRKAAFMAILSWFLCNNISHVTRLDRGNWVREIEGFA